MAINFDSVIKRAKKIIAKAQAKMHSAMVHLVHDDTDTSKLEGLVIILNSETTITPREPSGQS